ncbi:exodeoxyribonuclease V subunit gamma [Salinimonas sp. HHU 13199]|uniref:RecBCD enzyme subunit RecC n=1 Tax=Salinimonas profundi TaxID=2729140 RepID=A0ABR8LG92_9ALTE|nr:exodeoxyribonuclease V subunit gamma [Salinimonas profundi]MBD3584233.1 exodeoxyribonuclease V subunit gamma [Salinimonas profundi]
MSKKAQKKPDLLALYPSNKLEHLSYLLSALLKQQPGGVLQSETILVESPGMQHWLNMQLAKEQGIAINFAFPLPTRFMWNTARTVLGEDKVPQQSAYRREVLVWRIDRLIQSAAFCDQAQTAPVCRYWQSAGSEDEQNVRRLQFAVALADVFEQYQLYRPQWLFNWELGIANLENSDDEPWQALIWRMLVDENPLHPARLHQQAVTALSEQGCSDLPARIIVFAINTMAPQLVEFFDALAHHTDIHIFHLNPSVSYWGEVKSDRERALALRQQGIAAWRENTLDNPLLGNLGQQGRDLFNLLTALDTFEVAAFDTSAPEEQNRPPSLLSQVQQDILHGCHPGQGFSAQAGDHSIMIVNTHSALREVQGLHDNLLYLMQNNPDIKPSDIVVMCPAIEDYAPLIDAVFHRVGTAAPQRQDPPRIVCSIADRTPLDADPLVAAFISLLSLPDSRFEVTKIMDYLRLDAIRAKFSIDADDLTVMQFWLEQAHVHWGVDASHKQSVSDNADAKSMFSWYWGLERLLIGMALNDAPTLTGELLSVPDVEGQQSVILGKLIALVERLRYFASALTKSRTADEWHLFLTELKEACFMPSAEQADSWETIGKATSDVAAHCREAGYEEKLSLRQVRDMLVRRFSSPDAGNHFLTGQVTFCSMLPMRSIPFKVVCVLGLNDGEFPRQSTPVSIDLMTEAPRKRGDRSRRLEDRYLFLEAIISAREHLYLSYQANSAQDNSERQPSLVLQELLRILRTGYGFTDAHLHRLSLHPFSLSRFSDARPGFEKGWFRLANAIATRHAQATQHIAPLPEASIPEQVDVTALARSLSQPLRHFAREQLGLNLDNAEPVLNDAEPFSDNPLTRYKVLNELTEQQLARMSTSQTKQMARFSGELPSTPLTTALLDNWEMGAQSVSEAIDLSSAQAQMMQVSHHGITLSARVWVMPDKLVLWHSGSQNTKRKVEQFLTLLVWSANGAELPLEVYFLTWAKGVPAPRKAIMAPVDPQRASQLLARFVALYADIHCAPVPCYADVALTLIKKAPEQSLEQWQHNEGATFEWQKLWQGSLAAPGIKDDNYVKWFFPDGMSLDALPLDTLDALYRPLSENYKEKKV